MRLKACPKCQGDLVYNEDEYGTFWTCLQCGYLKDNALPGEPKPIPIRTTCEAGHPYTEATEGITRGGGKRCLICAREYSRQAYDRLHPQPHPVGRPKNAERQRERE